MTHASIFLTSAALGLVVLTGGAYAVLYSAGLARSSLRLERAGYVCYGGQLLIVLAVCLASPLGWLWKVFIAVSGVAYGFIPPVTWRLLDTLHHDRSP